MNSTTEVSAHDRILAERVAVRERRRLDPEARRLARRRRPRHRRRRAHASSTSPAASAARTRGTASRPSSTRSRPRPTSTCTSASWSASTSPTSRCAAGWRSSRRAPASDQKSILVNSGAEAVENAVKIARSATGRPAVVVFDNAFHGRTLLTMTMTAKVKPYKAGFGPFAPEVYRAPVPNPYRGITTDDAIAGLKQLFKADVDPATVACAVLEPVQGEGGFLPMPRDYLLRLQELCREHGILYVDDEVQSGRRPHREDVGGRALRRRRSRPARVAASRSAAACRSRPSPAPRRSWTPCRPEASAAPSAATHSRAPPRSRCSTRSPSPGSSRRRPRSATRCGRGSSALQAKHDAIGDVRGLGPMLAFELAEQAPEQASAIVAAAFERGLLLLVLRHVRQRDPAAGAADDRRRRARAKA